MKKIKEFCGNLVNNKWFEILIVIIILINSFLIGIETYKITSTMLLVQHIILGIFTFEIIIRFIAKKDLKTFFKSGWNNFDLFLVLISYVQIGRAHV